MTTWSRTTTATINLQALRHNFRNIRQCALKDQKILSVVKSNAYGHGGVEVARALVEEGTDWLGVGTIDEGVDLRERDIQAPILVLLGDISGGYQELLKYNLTPVIHNGEALEDFEKWLKSQNLTCPVHLKVDSGMTRLGFLPKDLEAHMSFVKGLSGIQVQGILSHLIDATDAKRTQGQQEVFGECLKILETNNIPTPFRHLANSIATVENLFPQYNMCRPGIILYGIYPESRLKKEISLKPVMTWKTKVLNLKDVPKGAVVSYNATFKAKRPSRIAVLPVGYADGYPRLLSNQASVLIHGKRVPVVGIVCMDLTMIDVTDIPDVQLGDEVVLLGGQEEGTITAEEMAQWSQTIPYEIVTRVATRVPRIYVDQ